MTLNERRTVDYALLWLDQARLCRERGDVQAVDLERRARAHLQALREGKSMFAVPRQRSVSEAQRNLR